MFYKDDNVLTMNFMNVACYIDLCSIKQYAEYINGHLVNYIR